MLSDSREVCEFESHGQPFWLRFSSNQANAGMVPRKALADTFEIHIVLLTLQKQADCDSNFSYFFLHMSLLQCPHFNLKMLEKANFVKKRTLYFGATWLTNDFSSSKYTLTHDFAVKFRNLQIFLVQSRFESRTLESPTWRLRPLGYHGRFRVSSLPAVLSTYQHCCEAPFPSSRPPPWTDRIYGIHNIYRFFPILMTSYTLS